MCLLFIHNDVGLFLLNNISIALGVYKYVAHNTTVWPDNQNPDIHGNIYIANTLSGEYI